MAARQSLSADPLSPLEVAVGMPLGGGPAVTLPRVPGLSPRTALQDATRAALETGPCWVAFSGGRDSSLVLAAAAAMARRAHLPAPVPLTFRFPEVPSTDEDPWQERVIDHLGLERWDRVELTDELDLLGDTATGLLRAIGPYWPANAHFMSLLARTAGHGTLLTGAGGDDLFASWRWHRAAAVLGGDVPRTARDTLPVMLALAPAPVRRAHERRRVERLPWLTDAAAAAHRRAVGSFADVPWRWDRQLAWMRGRDDITVALRTLARIGCDTGVRIGAPFLERRFLGALAAAGGAHGLGGRGTTLTRLFDGLLPADVLGRSDKATFSGSFWGSRAAAFAARWRGTGMDPALVDPVMLRSTWLSSAPDWRSADLLHRAWIQAH